ncbi:MAG: hypothetical protein AAF436_01655 [Myxococcota bacterium]
MTNSGLIEDRVDGCVIVATALGTSPQPVPLIDWKRLFHGAQHGRFDPAINLGAGTNWASIEGAYDVARK